MSRCQFLAAANVLSLALIICFAATAQAQTLIQTTRLWEHRLDARIAVLLYETDAAWEVSHRAGELFPMSSTFKPLLCGAILAGVDSGAVDLSENVAIQPSDLVEYSPVTSEHVETGMTIGALCQATMTISDNAAANLLLKQLDGPAGLTEFLRATGDGTTRLDRWETALNEATPGDPRDTTTPRAILETLERLLFDEVLSPVSAAQLGQWMIDDQVADGLIRAHLPKSWIIGDKTGAGGFGSRAIIAFLQTPEPRTYMAAIYLTESDAPVPERNAVLSDIGQAMIAEISARID
ncbi:class A beta-lactamase [Ruegeria conchae]|uniref:class A beta-lactamase n=1 Tax=Ruegeria conchae TaxID=981384 RepID=UPI0029C996D3|nr:class A beta-lactamase [Ruegeria conchae]